MTDCIYIRAQALFSQLQQDIYRQTDRLFALLMMVQWFLSVGIALWITPRTWIGATSSVHPHVLAAVLLGGVLTIPPVILVWFRSGQTSTRHGIAAAQMLMGALLIHLTGGRIETHFHVFCSLAFLAFYRDWRVLVTASTIVTVDHLIRGDFWPESIFGTTEVDYWRWVEHAGWVVLEDFFLFISCRQGILEMRRVADRQAELENTQASIEQTVCVRTAELLNAKAVSEAAILTTKSTLADLSTVHARLDAVTQSVPDILYMLSPAGKLVWWNCHLETVTGRTAADIHGMTPFDFLPAAEHAQVGAAIQNGIAAGFGKVKVSLQTLRGIVPYEFNIVPMIDGEGKLIGVAGSGRDISDLEAVAKVMQQAKEAADANAQSKSEFLASMSHEIRTPLNGVIGMLGLLLDTKLSDRQHEMAEVARSSGENLLTIINDILDFSKIEAGKLDIEPVPFDLRQAVEEVASMMAVHAAKRGLDILVRYPPDAPCQVIGDAGRIRQVLTNLVGNAVKFTDQGHVLIELTPETTDDGTTRFRFCVRDTGIGIAADKLESVFGRFSQADTSTTRRFGGAGLGLAIGKQLVELMHGTIDVTSEPGKGSTFWFTLPLPLDLSTPAETLPRADLTGVRVLIVDDNEVNRSILHEQVTSWGMRDESCTSAEEALTRLRSAMASGDPIEIAILDYHMPGMNGEQLALAIKADAALRNLLLVMLSSVGAPAGTSSTGLYAGYLVKPARQSQLHDTLATIWTAKSAGQPALVPSSRAPRAKSTSAQQATYRHARVLVVDDNTVNQKVGRMMLERLGCRVEVAANGQEAIGMVDLLPFDVVFMDCEMPVLDGFEATNEIRRREAGGRHVNIVAMTARAIQGDRERCLQAGMDDYISKPVKAMELERILNRWAPCETSPTQIDNPKYSTFEAALDPAVLANLKSMAEATDPALFEQIVESFLSDSRKGIVDLRQAADAESLRKTAHAIKGMCATVGAECMRSICQELEELGESGSIKGAPESIDHLAAEFQRAESELSAPEEAATP